MIQPLNPAFGKVVPLGGERKPPSASRITRLLQPHLDRMSDGRHMHRVTMENRCGNPTRWDPAASTLWTSTAIPPVDDWGPHG
jgi:hypothetical protein